MYDAAFSGLATLYAELEHALSQKGLVCSGCGECCHFDIVDHILYASDLERLYLVATATRPERPDGDAGLIAAGLRCPFQVNGGCEAREGRVLGCRLHFCRWENAMEETDFCEEWHGRLKRLHDEAGLPWRYSPLLPLAPRSGTGELS